MRGAFLIFAFLAAGCLNNVASRRGWEWKATDRAGYARASTEGTAPLIARAEEDFRASPAFPDDPPMPIFLVGVARHLDGGTLLAFEIGAVSDVNAVYVFNARGKIVDRYLHSYWGAPSNRRPAERH